MERIAGGEDVEIGRVAKRLPQLGNVALLELDLERAVVGERLRRVLRGVDALLVGGEGRPETRLEAGVDPAGLALPRNRRKSPERSGDRKQREQHEVDDELDLETPQCCAHHIPDTSCAGRPRRYLDRVMLSADSWTNMSGIERVVAAILLTGAVVGAAAFAHLLGRNPDLGGQIGLPKPGGPGIVQAAPLPSPAPLLAPGRSSSRRSGRRSCRARRLRARSSRRCGPRSSCGSASDARCRAAHARRSRRPRRPAAPRHSAAPAPAVPAAPAAPAPAAPAPTPAPAPSAPPPTACPCRVPPTPAPNPGAVTTPPLSHPSLPVPPVAAPAPVPVTAPLLTLGADPSEAGADAPRRRHAGHLGGPVHGRRSAGRRERLIRRYLQG